jgi:hypothetical protein
MATYRRARQDVAVRILGVLVGLWFWAMGAYAITHAERSPESPAGHWMSFPRGRRLGGALTMMVGTAVVVGSVTLM